MQEGKAFVGYEYKEITVPVDQISMYLDCYENFGWIAEDNMYSPEQHFMIRGLSHAAIRMKRNRKIMNKMELTRLQRNFEACAHEIEVLERAKTQAPSIWALSIGVIGTVFLAGATFAIIHEPPVIWLCVLLAIPGFIGWIIPYFVFQHMVEEKKKKYTPLIDDKLEEIYQICEKGHSLL